MNCKNCKDRFIGCHDRCKKYLIFRKKLDEARIKKEEDIKYICYLSDSIVRMKRSRRK